MKPGKDKLKRFIQSVVKLLIRFKFYPRDRGFREGNRIFFVTGRCKSGTTWMAYLLNSHPSLFCDINENQAFHQSSEVRYFIDTPSLLTDRVKGFYGLRTKKLLKNGLITNLINECPKLSARKLGDKSPEQDISLILEIFPKAQIVVMVRDFRDACISTAFHWSRESGTWKGWFTGPETKTLDNQFLIELLNGYKVRKDFEIYSKLASEKPEQVIIIRYEDMKSDPETNLKRVFEFLKIRNNASLVRKCLGMNTFEKLSKGRRPGEENKGSFFRKGVIGDWKNYFSEENVVTFKKIAGDTLIAAGYEKDNNWSA